MANDTTFKINNNSYAAFDATSLKNLIIDRLNNSGVFTDQNFEGSNINQVLDIVAYSYHTLLFYLNQTSSESLYSQATLNENINKIVKLLNYNPIGIQSATLNFNATAPSNLAANSYTIPRYSYFVTNGIQYSFNQDVTFTKTISASENLTQFSDNNLLYQGSYVEYPVTTSTGEPYELLTITSIDRGGGNIQIDHFNIDVYVKDNTKLNPTYTQYRPTESLFLEQPGSLVYQIRYNENGRYDIKFGNGTFGKQLTQGDEIAVYFLKTDGPTGEIPTGSLDNRQLVLYTSERFQNILTDTISQNLVVVTSEEAGLLQFSNITPSTKFAEAEGVNSIKENALNTYKAQFRLSTTGDVETYVKKNFSNIISSTKVVNNADFISGHLKYYFDLGVEKPSTVSRLMLNQVRFSSSCNFNNTYIYAVPRVDLVTSLTTRVSYLNTAQKQFIVDKLNPYKISTSEIVPTDPVYVEVGFGLNNIGETKTPSIANETTLEIIVDGALRRNFSSIQTQVAKIFTDFFKTTNDNLGVLIDLTELSSKIITIEGVQNFRTVRTSSNLRLQFPGISLLIFNPVYPETDIAVVQQNLTLPYFKFPYLGNAINFTNKIVLASE